VVAIAWVSEMRLALALFMARVCADHADDSVATNDAAVFAEGLYGWTDFHDNEVSAKSRIFTRGGGGAHWSAINYRRRNIIFRLSSHSWVLENIALPELRVESQKRTSGGTHSLMMFGCCFYLPYI
jgi:hypothetical protein